MLRTIAVLGLAALVLVGCTSSPPATPPPVPGFPITTPSATTPSTTPPAAAPTTTAGPGRCRSADLTASLGPADAGAGSVYLSIVFTNTGNRDCLLQGYPGVSYVTGDDGAQVGAAAARTGPSGPVVSLAPGVAASAKLQLVNVRNVDESVCRYTPVRGLRVYPPDETAALFLPYDTTGCALIPPAPNQQLTVQAVQPR